MSNTPNIRFKGYTDDWEQRKLGDISYSFEYGLNAAAKEFDGENKYIRITDIDDNSREFKQSEITSPDTDLTSADNYRLSYGDILFARTGASVGKTYIYKDSDGLVYYAGFLIRAKIKEEYNPEFVFQNTLTTDYEKYIKVTSMRSGQPGVNAQEYSQYQIMMPSKLEQDKISEYLVNLDNLITLHQRKSFSYYNILITWEQRKCNEILKPTKGAMKIGPFGSALKKEFYTETGVKVYAQENIFQEDFSIGDYYISEERYQTLKGCTLEPGDLVISMMGTIGACAIFPDNAEYGIMNSHLLRLQLKDDIYPEFIHQLLRDSQNIRSQIDKLSVGSIMSGLSSAVVQKLVFPIPNIDEQKKIAEFLVKMDETIALHQRVPPISIKEDLQMQETIVKTDILFCDYYKQWIDTYKKGAIRDVTMGKYNMAHEWLKKLVPNLYLSDITRTKYQQLLNEYAEKHEHQTTMDFHHHIKCALLDAVDEGLLERDPTRKAIIKGKEPSKKKIKFLNQFELQKLLGKLDLGPSINWDWFILLIAKTGLRFSEALALTPADFDFSHQMLSINKTWNYKGNGGFLPTKNKSSVRKIQLDWMTVMQFTSLLRELPEDKPIFIMDNAVYNSTVNDLLERRCKSAEIPIISIHGLRHTHASQLLFAGVSIASVARRLGHSSMTTTQKTYLHIIQELENKDIDLIMRSLSGLN